MAADDVNQQPGDAELCMLCKASSNPGEDIILCVVCQAPWHQSCLISSRESHFISDDYLGCPECENRINGDDLDTLTPTNNAAAASSFSAADNSMVAKILAIQADKSLTEEEKARKRQELLSGRPAVESPELEDKDDGEKNKGKVEKFKGKAKTTVEASKVSDESINCTICLNMPERPVTVSFLLRSFIFCSERCFGLYEVLSYLMFVVVSKVIKRSDGFFFSDAVRAQFLFEVFQPIGSTREAKLCLVS